METRQKVLFNNNNMTDVNHKYLETLKDLKQFSTNSVHGHFHSF